MADQKAQDKQPIYKKWWFWVIIVVVLIGIGGAGASNNKDAQKVGESESSESADTGEKSENKENQTFKVGDVVKIEDQEILVSSVKRNYAPVNEFVKVPEGKEYVKVDVQVQNKSKDTQDYNTLYWKMETSDGVIDDYMSAMMAQADDAFGSGDLAADGTKKGSIVFEIPKDDKALKLHYKPNLFTSREAVIELQ